LPTKEFAFLYLFRVLRRLLHRVQHGLRHFVLFADGGVADRQVRKGENLRRFPGARQLGERAAAGEISFAVVDNIANED